MSSFVRPFAVMVLVGCLGMAGSAVAGGVCGDGTIDAGEECDDGNTAAADSRTALPGCVLPETCLENCTCGCTSSAACDDGIACTIDTCSKAGACIYDDSACMVTTTTTAAPTTTTSLIITTTTTPTSTTTLPPPTTTTSLLITTTTIPPTTTTAEPTTTTAAPTTTTTLEVCLHDCGDPSATYGKITAVDAQGILRASVELDPCQLCVCDVDDSGEILALDALRDLQFAIGLPATLDCPPISQPGLLF